MTRKKTYVCHRLFTVGQFEQEENWLNSMAAKGMMLTRVNLLRYEFEQTTPGSYQYRLEFLDNYATHPTSISYLSFLEDNGVEHIGTTGRWIYLRKSTEQGPFELYSDNQSKYTHLRRIFSFCIFFSIFQGSLVLSRIHEIVAGNFSSLILVILLTLTFLLFSTTAFSVHKKMKLLKKNQSIFDA